MGFELVNKYAFNARGKVLMLTPIFTEIKNYIRSLTTDSGFKYKLYMEHDTLLSVIMDHFLEVRPFNPPEFGDYLMIEVHSDG